VLAQDEDSDSQNLLGLMYLNGEGVPTDQTLAMAWFTLAAEKGHTNAQYNLGVMYDNGWGINPDKDEIIEWRPICLEEKSHTKSNCQFHSQSFLGGLPLGLWLMS
jgi:TPR repeat protein